MKDIYNLLMRNVRLFLSVFFLPSFFPSFCPLSCQYICPLSVFFFASRNLSMVNQVSWQDGKENERTRMSQNPGF